MAYMKVDNFNDAMRDCQQAIKYDDKNSKAYNKLSKCHVAFGDLVAASIALQKSMELEPDNPSNKKDQKQLADLKITESLVKRAIEEQQYEKAVTNITQLLENCSQSISLICLKIDSLVRAFKFEEADKYSA
jgi:tetratricopeptide (TPR) repeat protein